MSDRDRIGFIGLGIMGKPMAKRLVGAGFPVVVHNRSQPAVEELTIEGADAATSPREVAERSDVVVTMLPDSPDVAAVVLGEDGVIAGLSEGMLLIDMSTIAPATARRVHAALAERQVEAIDRSAASARAARHSAAPGAASTVARRGNHRGVVEQLDALVDPGDAARQLVVERAGDEHGRHARTVLFAGRP